MAFSDPLSRRERQIMDILYRHHSATANEVLAALPDPPSSSAIRTLLRILEEKGHVQHTQDGLRYIYSPTRPPNHVAQHALSHLVQTFFGGSVERVVAALVSPTEGQLTKEELDRLSALIEQARIEEK